MNRRLTRLPLAIVLGGFVLASGCSSAPDDASMQGAALDTKTNAKETRTIATLRLVDWQSQLSALRSRGHDVAGVDVEANEVDVVLERAELTDLANDGFQVVRETEVPAVDFERATNGYSAPSDIDDKVHSFAERFPAIAAVSSIGKSLEGRDIWAVKITKDVGVHDPHKPVVLFNGAHHARELMSIEVPLDTIETLLTGYGNDPKITHWVDANETWVVPMLNVDGNNRVWVSDSLWRKNAHGCPASGTCPSHTGVDINRNYPYGWASCNGSSTNPRQDDYHGTAAGSEAETQAMMAFVGRIRPVFDISYHSYSELVLYPYGCQGQYTPTKAILQDIGGKMAAKLPSDDAPTRTYKPGTPWELLYSADGGDIDWMYHEYSVASFAIEINGTRQGFRPDYNTWRTKTVTKLRGAWQLLLDRLDGSAVRGIAHDASGQIVAGAQVDVAPATGSAGVQTRTVNDDGSFHVVLLPGSYRVTVSAAGHAPFTKTVTVADTRVDLDVVMN